MVLIEKRNYVMGNFCMLMAQVFDAIFTNKVNSSAINMQEVGGKSINFLGSS